LSDGDDVYPARSPLDLGWRAPLPGPSLPNPFPAGNAFGSLAPLPPPPNAVAGGYLDPTPPSPYASLADVFGALAPLPPAVPPTDPLVGALLPRIVPSLPRVPIAIEKRKVYFAFSFSDVMRVNCMRNSGKIGSRETKNYARDFYDRSIWEQRSITKENGLKALMRRGVEHSSAICVLVGSDTWQSRWVRYEIARAVIDGRGLLAVHVHTTRGWRRMRSG